MKSKIYEIAFVVLLTLGLKQIALADFNATLLLRGDRAVLAAPAAIFYHEIDRLKLPQPEFHAVLTDSSYTTDNTRIPELNDLRAALRKEGKSESETEQIVLKVFAERKKVYSFEREYETWEFEKNNGEPYKGDERPKKQIKPEFPRIDPIVELPEEFADYFRATVIWRNPALQDKSGAREAWQRILNAPRDRRHFRSTWAAYMLGKSWEKEAPEKAIGYYQKVRTLARTGFSDSLGLAAASFGWEARIYLNQTNYEQAIELYLEQKATGDNTAYGSLISVSQTILAGNTNSFPVYLKNPRVCRVVTAYIISTAEFDTYRRLASDEMRQATGSRVLAIKAWLAAARSASLRDSDTAELLALAAYQREDWEEAQFWIDHSDSAPAAQWVQAKLLLREGRTNESLAILIKLQRELSKKSLETNAPVKFIDGLHITGKAALSQIRGELAVLHLARGKYAEALDSFMRGDFWLDSAYVADRILTIDELKDYVDRYWPSDDETMKGKVGEEKNTEKSLPASLRYLLARRLMRSLRGNEARPYYPAHMRAQFDTLADALLQGWNESLPAAERARALLAAGTVTRSKGMELMGTEMNPDCFVYDGDQQTLLTASNRTNKDFTLFPASEDEQRRYSEHAADPDTRFHYRFQAAFLGWEAARLLPNNSEETARTLATAGSWIKSLDPETADLFYKALVRRCRNTPAGAEADRIRWFPQFNERGEVIARKKRQVKLDVPPGELNSPDQQPLIHGIPFILEAGDTLQVIADAMASIGQPLTVKQIIEANPGLEPSKLQIGQRIMIPIR